MSTEDFQRVLTQMGDALRAVPTALLSVGKFIPPLPQLVDTAVLPSELQKLVTKVPSASAIGTAAVAVIHTHRKVVVICASGVGVVMSCCALNAMGAPERHVTTAACAAAMQAEAGRRKAQEERQRRQQEATARAQQLKLEAKAARAAARELNALASEDEKRLALASVPVDKPDVDSESPTDNLTHRSPTKALRFAPSALSGARTGTLLLLLPVYVDTDWMV